VQRNSSPQTMILDAVELISASLLFTTTRIRHRARNVGVPKLSLGL
jgi:hypothetical protein